MRNIITNKLFQIAVAGAIAVCIGYTFFGTNTITDQDALETTTSVTTITETTNAVDVTNNTTENTGDNHVPSTTPEEESEETTENQ